MAISEALVRWRGIRKRIRYAWDEVRIALKYARYGVQQRPATASERLLLLSVPDLINAGYSMPFEPAYEECLYRRFPNGGVAIKYAYEAQSVQPGYLPLTLTSRIEVEPSVEAALETFHDGVGAYESGVSSKGGRLVTKGNLQQWCENAYVSFMLIEPNDTVAGCVLSFQKERMVYSVVLTGVILEREEDIEEVIVPFLERGLLWSEERGGAQP